MDRFNTLNMNIFGDNDLALRTLKAAYHYLSFYHERFWYEDESQEEHIDACLKNLKEITKKMEADLEKERG